jgi:3-hydroxy-9,10-secoandrosta-1,3,5(10)-triene-9,17-dione monooxygenase reductase component
MSNDTGSGTPGFDPGQFRQALGAFTTGVTIVTTRGPDGLDCGLTANSFNSVSVDPPMVLWSLNKAAGSVPAFTGSEYFAVHILATEQEALSNRFASRGEDRFAGLTVSRGPGGIPLLDGCSARFQCRTTYQYEGGDHIIFVGEVLTFDHFAKPPLVFHGGGYKRLQHQPGTPADSSFSENWLGFQLGRAFYQLLVPIRRQLHAMGMHDIDFELLALLSVGEDRTLAELHQTLEFVGKDLQAEDLQPWIARGLLVTLQQGEEPLRLHLSEAGRALVVQWLAFAKAAEMTALAEFSYEETQQFKLLLGKLIQHTNAELPEHWREENIWRDKNLWQPDE